MNDKNQVIQKELTNEEANKLVSLIIEKLKKYKRKKRIAIDEEVLNLILGRLLSKIRKNDSLASLSLLTKIDFSGISFQGIDIHGIDFTNTNAQIDPQCVYEKDLSNVNLSGYNMAEKDFTGVLIAGANLENTNARIDPQLIKGKSLHDTNVKGCTFINKYASPNTLKPEPANFTNVDIRGANLENTNAQIDPQLVYAKNLQGTNLKGIDLSNKSFAQVWITGANLEGTNANLNPHINHSFENDIYISPNYYRKDIYDLSYTCLKGLDLSKVDFQDVKLYYTNLENTKAHINVYSFPDNTLRGCNFRGCTFGDDYDNMFENIDVEEAIFAGTNAKIDPQLVEGKSLFHTNLEGCNMEKEDFSDVNIENANLKNTNAHINPYQVEKNSIKGTNLTNCILYAEKSLSDIEYDSDTILTNTTFVSESVYETASSYLEDIFEHPFIHKIKKEKGHQKKLRFPFFQKK